MKIWQTNLEIIIKYYERRTLYQNKMTIKDIVSIVFSIKTNSNRYFKNGILVNS